MTIVKNSSNRLEGEQEILEINEQQLHLINKELNKLFSLHVVSDSFSVVRWHENKHEDVVCVDKKTALEYIEKYNKLAGEEMCFLDNEVWLPLEKA